MTKEIIIFVLSMIYIVGGWFLVTALDNHSVSLVWSWGCGVYIGYTYMKNKETKRKLKEARERAGR